MHIIYFLHGVPQQEFWMHGAGNYVTNIARIMVSRGHEVGIIIEGNEERNIKWNGVDIYYIEAAKGFKDTGKRMPTYKKVFKNLCRSIRYNRKAAEINKYKRVDIVQSVDIRGLVLFRKRNIPYIVRCSEYASLWMEAEKEYYNYTDSFVTDKRLDIWLTHCAIKRANIIIAPSQLVANILEEKIGKKVLVVESPVLVSNTNKICLQEPGLVENKYFVTFGVNSNRKCITMLAEMMDNILETYPDMKYVVIGKDKMVTYKGERKKASLIYEENVIKHKDRFCFMGDISDKDRLFSIIHYAACCILPTRVDNLPNTVLESMALGKIVISSTNEYGTSVEQLIVDGKNGFLIQVDNGQELLRKLDTVMNLHPDEKSLIEQNAKKRVEDLRPEKVYENMINIYYDAINSQKN